MGYWGGARDEDTRLWTDDYRKQNQRNANTVNGAVHETWYARILPRWFVTSVMTSSSNIQGPQLLRVNFTRLKYTARCIFFSRFAYSLPAQIVVQQVMVVLDAWFMTAIVFIRQ